MISSVLSRLFTMVTVIGGRGGEKKTQPFGPYRASCWREAMVVTAWAAWHRRGLLCAALPHDEQAAMTMGNGFFCPPFLWKTILSTSKRRDALLEKDLQADTPVSNSVFKNRGVDFLCFSGRSHMKYNCLI